MTPVVFEETDLPLEDLAEIGLKKNGQLLLEEADLKALLSGRRTQMLQLEKLEFAGFKIDSLKAKLQLVTGADGKPELLLHPTYLQSTPPSYLTEKESWALETGDEQSLEKEIVDSSGQRKRVLIEFDPETNQFLETDQDKLEAPEEVNGQPLTAEQKARYKKGQEVEVPDGTKLQYTATNREGLRANRIGLILSVVFDGGISYLLFHGLKTLTGLSSDYQETPLSDAYLNILAKMQDQKEEETSLKLDTPHGQQNRGYNRSSAR